MFTFALLQNEVLIKLDIGANTLKYFFKILLGVLGCCRQASQNTQHFSSNSVSDATKKTWLTLFTNIFFFFFKQSWFFKNALSKKFAPRLFWH